MDNWSRPNLEAADYQRILQQDIMLIDVRAPLEFRQSALPCAINLPLMDDAERVAVGTCYKRQGRLAAVALGHQLVSGSCREQRLDAWRQACQRYPMGYLCCARGGMRSHIVQSWLRETGIDYPLVTGGYKALRQCVIQTIDQLAQLPVVLVGGCTGSGKTALVRAQPCGVDLEGLARHRGSSFGRMVQPQPSQSSFENSLAVQMLQLRGGQTAKQHLPWRWVLEDEGRAIGANHIPQNLREQMSVSPIVVVEEPFERRIERLRQEYFIQALADFQGYYGEETGWQQYSEWLQHGLFAIRRRLGLARYQECYQYLQQALLYQQQRADTDAHLNWLVPLLRYYYDPMYHYQLEKKAGNIVFRGDYHQVVHWLEQH